MQLMPAAYHSASHFLRLRRLQLCLCLLVAASTASAAEPQIQLSNPATRDLLPRTDKLAPPAAVNSTQPASITELRFVEQPGKIADSMLQTAASWSETLRLPKHNISLQNPARLAMWGVLRRLPPIDNSSEQQTGETELLVIPLSPSANQNGAEELELPPERCFIATPITSLTTDIAAPPGELPASAFAECQANTIPIQDRRQQGAWALTEHHWAATGMRHRPLYFEEINAERYGYTHSYFFQPFISAAHFFITIPALPYKLAAECPRRCSYTLGHYRPGSCVPRRNYRWPCRFSGALAEVGVVAGLIVLIP